MNRDWDSYRQFVVVKRNIATIRKRDLPGFDPLDEGSGRQLGGDDLRGLGSHDLRRDDVEEDLLLKLDFHDRHLSLLQCNSSSRRTLPNGAPVPPGALRRCMKDCVRRRGIAPPNAELATRPRAPAGTCSEGQSDAAISGASPAGFSD